MPYRPPRNTTSKPTPHPRPTACKRGYDRQHRKQREQELSDEPLCWYCLQRGRVTIATCIDHILALARGGSALDPDNRRPSCEMCNSVKAATVDKGLPNRNADYGPLETPPCNAAN